MTTTTFVAGTTVESDWLNDVDRLLYDILSNPADDAAVLTGLGVTATAAELNVLDGITSTVAELNILDGVTSSTAELNILDGATLTVTELNYVDGVTSAIQTQLDAKAALAGNAAQAFSASTFTGALTGDVTGNVSGSSGSCTGNAATATAVTGSAVVTGAISSSGATSGIGYATGAGGIVIQATDKATGVTLSKVTGQITLNGAALAAATIVSFVLTNTAIAVGDVLIINHVSIGTFGAYTFNARCAAGSATIDVRNATAGSLSEAIVIQFTLIKSVVA